MRLEELVTDLDVRRVTGDLSVEVTSVTNDSVSVGPGALFCCLPGARRDGHEFAADAVARGAVALLCERPTGARAVEVEVEDARGSMARVASAFHGHPSRVLDVIGVTGTNGKTTTAHFVKAVLKAAGKPTEVLGTMSGARTTPEAPVVQATLARARDNGMRAVAMEVSSPALVQRRVDGMRFRVAVFTNLSHDHLEVHGSMEAYFEAKALLFDPSRSDHGVVNADDPYGRRLLDRQEIPMTAYSIADASDLDVGLDTASFTWRDSRVTLQTGGRFNVLNALAAATVGLELAIDPAVIAAGLSSLPTVRGHVEQVDAGQPFKVVVDYAHTPVALEEVLKTARSATRGRVIVVFGCGGDRDVEKRPLMGAAAAAGADITIVTSDNPRSEDPATIIDQVLAGVGSTQVEVEPDRRAAIHRALVAAGEGDIVVIAGKGHETGQEVAGRVLPFDDREVVMEALRGRAS